MSPFISLIIFTYTFQTYSRRRNKAEYFEQARKSPKSHYSFIHTHTYLYLSLSIITYGKNHQKNKIIAVDGIFGVPGERSRGNRFRQGDGANGKWKWK